MDKKNMILCYCQEQNRGVTAKDIINDLFPGKSQPYINSAINDLVQEKKLIRNDARPYTVHVPKPGEVIPEVKNYSKAQNRNHANRKKPSITIAHPCPEEADKYIREWNERKDRENYRLQEVALDKLFFELCPENKNIEDILIKVAALNDFYSTNILSVYPVAKRILSLDIDDRLTVGDSSLVKDISFVQMKNGTEKNFYSFATKYCSHHRPKQFAIYDSYVDKILRYFRDKDRFFCFANSDLKNYPRFNAVLNQFRQFYGLQDYDLKMIDRYLWQLGKAAFPREYK